MDICEYSTSYIAVQFSNVGKTDTVASAGVRGDECTVEFEGDYYCV